MNRYFFFKDLDSHYIIYFLGMRLQFKHKCRFRYKPVEKFGLNIKQRNPALIVSLTSYPARINTVHITINTLLNQTLTPDKVILWLAREQFNDIPDELKRLEQYGLTIEWCDEDLKSYKKLVPALLKYPEDIIVTADDDVYYDSYMLEHLYQAYLKNSDNIYVRRAVKLNLNGSYLRGVSPRKYFYQYEKNASFFNQIMGGSGCLYPPKSLYKDVTDMSKIKELLPTHDDAFFWAMAVLNDTKIQVIDGFDADLNYVEGTQDVGLIHKNKKSGEGICLEEAYRILIREYPQILSKLKQNMV